MSVFQLSQLALIVAIAAIAGYLDVRSRRLPNWLCAAALVAGLGLAFVATGLQGMSFNLLHVLAALAVGMVLNALGVIGAGDAKFYASLAAWFPLQAAVSLIVSVASAGLVLLVFWFTLRRLVARPVMGRDRDNGPFSKLPFGVAIGVGAALLQSAAIFAK